MADVDPNLVQAIAQQVLAALRGAGPTSPADVHAPIGICTGDYSKFAELKNIQTAPAPSESMPAKAAPTSTTLHGVITVTQLRAIKGAIRLVKGAILTPLAQDYIREKNLNIMTDESASISRINNGQSPAATPAFWWIDGQCPSVAKIIDVLRPNAIASREKSGAESLRNVVKELALLVKNRRVTGGLLFVNSAARAACYANRCQSLRAIVATSDKAVSDGIELLGVNTLIIEYPQFGFKAMMAFVKPFVESLHQAPAAVQRELSELATCN